MNTYNDYILGVCEFMSQGRRTRLRIAHIVSKSGLNLTEVHAALRELQASGKVVCYRLDNPREITPADKAAAMDFSGSPRHIVYVD